MRNLSITKKLCKLVYPIFNSICPLICMKLPVMPWILEISRLILDPLVRLLSLINDSWDPVSTSAFPRHILNCSHNTNFKWSPFNLMTYFLVIFTRATFNGCISCGCVGSPIVCFPVFVPVSSLVPHVLLSCTYGTKEDSYTDLPDVLPVDTCSRSLWLLGLQLVPVLPYNYSYFPYS